MSKSPLEMVRDFHVAIGSPVLPSPGVPPHDRVRARVKLVFEESMELIGAMIGFHDEEVKRLVLYTSETMFEAVHENNMTKIGGPKNADGKQMKPPGYVKFDAAKFLAENGWAN